jgi:hypothetical protein
MSHTTLIKYQNKGIWLNEAFIEVLSQYLCETFETIGINEFSQNLSKLYYSLDGNRAGEYYGMVNILLDQYVLTAADKDFLINVITQTKILIASKGIELSISTLNTFENTKANSYFKNTWLYPIKIQSLIATLEIVEQLLDGSFPYAIRRLQYIGFPDDNAEANI